MQATAIRSLLFVPGNVERMMLKALGSGADAVILDLEDAVALADKAAARERTCAVLSEAERGGVATVVRVNAFDTGMTAGDLAAVMPGRPDAVMLPKCAGPHEVEQLGFYLDALEAREGIAHGKTRIVTVATETAAATLRLGTPASSVSRRLAGLLWGSEDLAASLGAAHNLDSRGELTFPYQYARSQCLYAANACEVLPIDRVYTNIGDPDGLEQEARSALRDGFTAKAAIHPSQIEIINRVMTPNDEQIAWAREVVRLLATVAVATLDGKMIDIPHKRIAEKILARARPAQ